LQLDLTSFLIGFAILIVSLSIHEAAHAWTADRLGDSTARRQGRVSLNPIVHIDPIGTLLLPVLSMFSPLPLLGWAKPVPVTRSRLRHPRRDFMIIAAAGPISNFLQALLITAVFHTFYDPYASDLLPRVLRYAVQMNLFLAFFNLIPVPPLDGGNVLAGLVPESAARVLDQLRQFGFIALYALMLSGMLSEIIVPPTRFLMRLLQL
jgi:Zn-dependent protease